MFLKYESSNQRKHLRDKLSTCLHGKISASPANSSLPNSAYNSASYPRSHADKTRHPFDVFGISFFFLPNENKEIMRYEMKEINPEVKNCNILKKKKFLHCWGS